jgi:hypothetical protein
MNEPIRAKEFLVIDVGSRPEVTVQESPYTAFLGGGYTEQELREWAHEQWGVPMDASLEDVAAGIMKGGWLLYRGVWEE